MRYPEETEATSMRKLVMALGLTAMLAAAVVAVSSSDAAAGWRGHGGMYRGHVHAARFAHGPRFQHGGFHARRTHLAYGRFHHRPFARRYLLPSRFYGPRFVAPVLAYGPECIVRRKVRWTPCGPVRVARHTCY